MLGMIPRSTTDVATTTGCGYAPMNRTIILLVVVLLTVISFSSVALSYQKYLLSESNENKIEYLFLLEDLFKKSDLNNIYPKFLSDRIEEIGVENLPEKYNHVWVK